MVEVGVVSEGECTGEDVNICLGSSAFSKFGRDYRASVLIGPAFVHRHSVEKPLSMSSVKTRQLSVIKPLKYCAS